MLGEGYEALLKGTGRDTPPGHAQVRAAERPGPRGQREIEILVGQVTDWNISTGHHDISLAARYRVRPRGRPGLRAWVSGRVGGGQGKPPPG